MHSPTTFPLKLLVVEDNEAFRRFICSVLQQKAEFQVSGEAVDGLEAVQKAERLQPDLILLDIGLPKLNGLEAGRRIRKVAPTSKIVFVSQESAPDVIREALSFGAQGYIPKTHAQDLLPAIDAVLSGKLFVSGGLEFSEDIVGMDEVERADEIHLRYAAIVDSSDDAIIAKTLQGLISAWNPAAQRMFGYTEGEAIGQPITIIIPPELQDEEAQILRRVRAGERIEHFETRRISKEGKTLDVSLTISPIKDAKGRIIGASKIARDVTESKRGLTALRESEERLHLVANTAPVMIWMSGVDKVCTYINQRWLEFTGRSSESELATGWVGGIHPEDAPKCLDTYTQSFDRREPFQLEYRLRRHDGEYRWVLDHGVPRFNADGSFAGYIGSGIDVTDRKLVEEALQKSDERLRLAMESGKSVGWDRDLKSGRDILFGDLRNIFGLPQETLVGCVGDFNHLVYPEDLERTLKAVNDAMKNREPYAAEFRVLRSDGSVGWLSAKGKFYYSADGEPERTLGAAVDITERKLTEQALCESEERLRLAAHAGKMYAFDWDVATDVILRSEEFTRLPGLAGEPTNLTKQQLLVRIHPEDRATFTYSIAKLTPEKPNTQISFRLLRPDGSVIWLERTGHAFFDENGKMVRMLGMAADITERKLAEEALAKSEERLRLAQRAARIGTFEWNIQTGVNTWTSELEAMYGLSPGSFGGTQTDFENLVHHDDRAKVIELDNWALKTGQPTTGEWRVVWPDGSVHWITGRWQVLMNDSNEPSRMIGVNIDVTESKRVEQALHAMNRALEEQTALLQSQEELLRIFVKNVPAAVAMLDRDMRYLQVSDRWCSDYLPGRAQILGRSHYEIFPDMPERWKEVHRRALEGETLRADEDRWDGEAGTHWARWEVRPWKTAEGCVGGILILAEDITRRKQMEETLSNMTRKLIQAQEEERSRLARELHDDINQQIALLGINLESLKQRSPTPPEEWRAQIVTVGKQLEEIGKNIQALSHRLHSPKLEYLGLAAAAASFCREFSDQHGVEITYHSENVPRELPQEIAVSLFRVLQEGVQNAAKHSGSRRFEVSLQGESNEIELTVRDSGIGFDPEEAIKGRGIGLTSMTERLKLVDGELSIDSRAGHGSTIRARVPLRSGMYASAAG